MISPSRALTASVASGVALPEIPSFRDLYAKLEDGGLEVVPRRGEVVMVAGRSGSQKSGFVMYWVEQMGLPTLYFSGDMSKFTASARLASIRTGLTTQQVESAIANGGGEWISEKLSDSQVAFSFETPIRLDRIELQLEAWVEVYDSYPEVIVVDNLQDVAGAESDYSAQMEVMQILTELARHTGATVIVCHHASDKSWDAKTDPFAPPSRDQVKNGLSEKPSLTLCCSFDPNTGRFFLACTKQRMGPCDPTARRVVSLLAQPKLTRFEVDECL